MANTATIEAGRIRLVEGAYVEDFIQEVTGFPALKHDEYVDLLNYAADYYIGANRAKTSTKSIINSFR